MVGEPFPDVFDVFLNPDKELTCSSSHILKVAGTFHNICDICASARDQLVNSVFFVITA